MSKADNMFSFMSARIGEWCCSVCSSGSNQPAATFRELKNRGYNFEEISPNRWGKTMFCPVCGMNRTHYRLISPNPSFSEHKRYGFSNAEHKRIVDLFDNRDAITGASISSRAEIDHKKPWTRLEADIDVSKLSDEQVKKAFQLLTREHNLLKDRMCDKCKKTGKRPPFLEIEYWYAGNEQYCGTCEGCGWFDSKLWRQAVNKILKRLKKNG